MRASTDNTMHCEPNWRDSSASRSGRAIAAVFTDTLSAPARNSESTSATERTPPPTVSGMNTCSAVRRTTSSMVARPEEDAVTSRKRQFVGALGVVGRGELDGIARVAQVLEVDSLDHPALIDVQAGNHTHRYVHQQVVLRVAEPIQDLHDVLVYAGSRRQRRPRRGGPLGTGQVGDDATGRAHQRNPGCVIPDVVTETDCPAEDSSADVGHVDASGAVHPQLGTHPAQLLEHRKPVAAGKPAAASRR